MESEEISLVSNEILLEPENITEFLEKQTETLKAKDTETSITSPTLVLDILSTFRSHGTTKNSARFPLHRLVGITSSSDFHNESAIANWTSRVPPNYTQLQIEIHSESDIEGLITLLLRNSLPWTNVCLLEESYINYLNFPPFASQLGPQIQHLQLDKFFGSISEISFISCCTSLKSLTILELDVRSSPRMLLPSEFPNLNKTFGGVKSLVIKSIFFNVPRQCEFFKNFLLRFPKLETLIYIPTPHGPKEIQLEVVKSLQSKYLIKPVVDYLNERHNNLASLPVNPIRRTVDAAGVFSNAFPELALACAKNGAFLTNVNEKQLQSLFLTQDTVLSKILAITETLSDRRSLAKWINLREISLRTSGCEIRTDSPHGMMDRVVTFPQLKTIHLVFDSDSKVDPEFKSLKKLLYLLFGSTKPRLGVNELSLIWPSFGHNTPGDIVSPNMIVKSLPNLQKFHVKNWKAWDEDLLEILKAMKRLNHLAVEDCPSFTELGFLGYDQDNPAILQCKELKILEIANRSGSGSITDTSFMSAFRNLRLRVFLFDTIPNLVTKAGYDSLKESPINDTLEIFPEPRCLHETMSRKEFLELRHEIISFIHSKKV